MHPGPKCSWSLYDKAFAVAACRLVLLLQYYSMELDLPVNGEPKHLSLFPALGITFPVYPFLEQICHLDVAYPLDK
jgi:hypothetical protein